MEKSLRHAVIEWDIITWGRAVDFWNADKLSSAEKQGGGYVLFKRTQSCS